MSTKERARDRGRRIGLKLLARLGDDLRRGRVLFAASQGTVGRLAGTSRSMAARYETGHYEAATIVQMSELLAVVGLGLSVSTYPLGDGPRDERHAEQLAAFLAHVRPPLGWRTEVPLPNPGDARSWDALISGLAERTGIEFERVVRDTQALSRRIALKRRDGGVDHLLVVVADTALNRASLRRFGTLLPELPRLARADVIAALEAGRHPGDGLVLF